jgi:hypothetical protein
LGTPTAEVVPPSIEVGRRETSPAARSVREVSAWICRVPPGHAQPLSGRTEFIFSLVLDNQL